MSKTPSNLGRSLRKGTLSHPPWRPHHDFYLEVKFKEEKQTFHPNTTQHHELRPFSIVSHLSLVGNDFMIIWKNIFLNGRRLIREESAKTREKSEKSREKQR
jgi:hypothetical protein